jgi:hypothetical protein
MHLAMGRRRPPEGQPRGGRRGTSAGSAGRLRRPGKGSRRREWCHAPQPFICSLQHPGFATEYIQCPNCNPVAQGLVTATTPPFTAYVVPVMSDDSSSRRHRTTRATSSDRFGCRRSHPCGTRDTSSDGGCRSRGASAARDLGRVLQSQSETWTRQARCRVRRERNRGVARESGVGQRFSPVCEMSEALTAHVQVPVRLDRLPASADGWPPLGSSA